MSMTGSPYRLNLCERCCFRVFGQANVCSRDRCRQKPRTV